CAGHRLLARHVTALKALRFGLLVLVVDVAARPTGDGSDGRAKPRVASDCADHRSAARADGGAAERALLGWGLAGASRRAERNGESETKTDPFHDSTTPEHTRKHQRLAVAGEHG